MPLDALAERPQGRDLFAEFGGGGRDLLEEFGAAPNADELAVASQPARMTLARGGQAVLGEPARLAEEPPGTPSKLTQAFGDAVDAVGKWLSGWAKRGGRRALTIPEQDPFASAINPNVASVSGADAQRYAEAKVRTDAARADFTRNVVAGLENVPADYKQIMGGLLQAVGDAVDTQPKQIAGPAVERGERSFGQELVAIGRDFYEQGEEQQKQATRQGGAEMKPGFGAEAVTTAVRSLAQMLPAIGLAGASPARVIAIISSETAAQSYGKAKDQGYQPGEAATYALLHGVIEGGTEYLPMKALLSRHPNAGAHLYNFLIREVPTEMLATTLQSAVDKLSVEPNMTFDDFMKAMKLTIASTPLAGGVQVGATRMLQRARGAPAARNPGIQPPGDQAPSPEAGASPVLVNDEAVSAAAVDRIAQARTIDEALIVAAEGAETPEAEFAAAFEGEASTLTEPAPVDVLEQRPRDLFRDLSGETAEARSPEQWGATILDRMERLETPERAAAAPGQPEASTGPAMPQRAMQAAWERVPEDSREAVLSQGRAREGDVAPPAVASAPPTVLGRTLDQVTSGTLRAVAAHGRTPELRQFAQAELDRRAAAPEARTGTLTLPQTAEAPAAGPGTLILGRPASDLNLRTLETVARAGAPGARAAATAELERRRLADPESLPAVGIDMTPPYTAPAPGEGAQAHGNRSARPDAIRDAIRDLLRVPINEGRFGRSRDALGIYKVPPRTIRVRNQNDIAVIAHETGHHFSETSRPVRVFMRAHEAELRRITPYAAGQKSAALQREEGFAEYLRLRWTAPAQAQAKAPSFHRSFERYVDENGYRKVFDEIERAIGDWMRLPPADRILAKVGENEPEFRKRLNLDRVIFEVFDRWLPMKLMREDLDPDIAPSADPFKLAHLLAGDAALIEDWLLHETVPFDFQRRADLNDRGKALAEILKPVMDQQREFGAYLIAKRANELMRRGKENLYSKDEIAAGLRLETPEFKAAAKELYAFQDRLLDYAVEGGLLSQHVADKFRSFPFYVPFLRTGESTQTSQRGDIFKAIRGGTANLRDPIANVIENTVRVIHATNRNFVLAKAHDLARTVVGGGRWLEDVPMPERAVKLETRKIIDQLREQGIEVDTSTAEAIASTQTFFVKNPFGDDRDRVIVIRRGGQPYALQVNNEMLWQALERFEPVDMTLVEKMLAVPADVLRAGVVLSPDFMARNFARDTLSGFLQSKKGMIPIAGTLNGFKEVATRSDAARLYRAFGGAYGDLWRAESGLEHKLVERMARRGGFDPGMILTPRGLISLLQRIGSVTEAGTRVAEFKNTMEPGDVDSLIDAAYNAREVSVDFGMHGHSRSVRLLTRITPFLNPALQGWYKLARSGKDQPFATLLRGGMLAAASILLYLNNRDKDWYQEIEHWERSTYWHVDLGVRDARGKVIPFRIPKPFEWGAIFGSIPEALTQVAIEKQGKEFAKRLESIFDDVLMLRTIPTALLVPAELWANKSQFLKRPIVPESRERLAAELQANPGTSLTARKAGELADIAPAKIDHAVRGFFGTLGTYTLMLSDQALQLSGDGPRALPLPWQRAPVVKVFFRDPDGANSKQTTEFYELLKDARRAEASLKYMEPERMAEYYRKHERKIEAVRDANKVAKAMAGLRRENEEIRKSRDMPDAERLNMIAENNRHIRWLARDFMKQEAR